MRQHQNRQDVLAFSLRCGGPRRCSLLALNKLAAETDGRSFASRVVLNLECDAVQARRCALLLARRGLAESNLCVVVSPNTSGT